MPGQGSDLGVIIVQGPGFGATGPGRSWAHPIPEGLPADIHAQVVALDKRFAVHLAAHVLDPSTLSYGLSDSPAA